MEGLDLLSRVATETWDNLNESPAASVALNAPTDSLGNLKCTLTPTNTCARSPHTGYHLEREKGRMRLKVTCETTTTNRKLKIRAVLLRAHKKYRHIVVDKVCHKHVGNCPNGTEDQVLSPAEMGEGIAFGDCKDTRKSVTWTVQTDHEGLMQKNICLLCRCMDTCSISEDLGPDPAEASRDLLLVLTIEDIQANQVIARESLKFWPKAKLANRELNKEVRRLYKGAPRPHLYTNKQKVKSSLGHAIRMAKHHNMEMAEFNLLVGTTWGEIPRPTIKTITEHSYSSADSPLG